MVIKNVSLGYRFIKPEKHVITIFYLNGSIGEMLFDSQEEAKKEFKHLKQKLK